MKSKLWHLSGGAFLAAITLNLLGADAIGPIDTGGTRVISEQIGQGINYSTPGHGAQFGYLTYVAGVNSVFAHAPENETNALFTFYQELTNLRVTDNGPVRVISRTGTNIVYFNPGGASFANPDSFRAGTPIQTSIIRQQVVIDTTTLTFTAFNEDTLIGTSAFSLNKVQYEIGKVGDVLKTARTGRLNTPGLSPIGWFGGYTTGVANLTSTPEPPVQASTSFSKLATGTIVHDAGSSFACSWVDYNNDGFVDLFVTNVDGRNFLYLNNHDGTFKRITVGPIPNDTKEWHGCAWADYDNDGYIDLLVASTESPNGVQAVLYRNNDGATFTRMPDKTIGGIVGADAGYSQGPVWADYDNDGFLDLFVNRWGSDWLYHNDGTGGFTSITNILAGGAGEDGFTAGWADYNNDGRPDLFVAVTSNPQTRHLYLNLGGGNFAPVATGSIVTDGGLCTGSAWGDYNNDGFLDLFLSNWNTNESNFLYRNNGDGTFTRMTSDVVGSIASDTGGFDQAAWGDYDNDGYLDLYVTATPGLGLSRNGNALYHNNGDGTFTRILTGALTTDVANSVGCAWADYDNDGFLDLFVANGGVVGPQNNALYHNDGKSGGNNNSWLKVRCTGTVSNRSAIGAKVRVKAKIAGNALWQLREINSGSGICQNPLETHFGLRDATNVDEIRIEWPSGTVQEIRNVAPGQIVNVTEPAELRSELTNGAFQLSVQGGRGFNYEVETSTNLQTWSLLRNLTVTNLNGVVELNTGSALSDTHRFFRAHSPTGVH
jgi:hypothetical protein